MTKEKKIESIYKAIDAILSVATDVEESDAHYLMNSEKSVVSHLRSLISEIESNN